MNVFCEGGGGEIGGLLGVMLFEGNVKSKKMTRCFFFSFQSSLVFTWKRHQESTGRKQRRDDPTQWWHVGNGTRKRKRWDARKQIAILRSGNSPKKNNNKKHSRLTFFYFNSKPLTRMHQLDKGQLLF